MKNVTLDPENWNDPRELGTKMIDDVIKYLSNVRDNKIWNPIPEEIKDSFTSDAPAEGSNVGDVYKELLKTVYPYPKGNAHPKFWGWVEGSGDIYGALADFFMKGMNVFGGFGEHSAIYVEEQVLGWLKSFVGYPKDASGIIVTGSSIANLIGINAARYSKSPFDDRQEGLNQSTKKLLVYCSNETHHSNHKAVEILGLGKENIREIETHADYTINLEKLKRTIEEDKKQGYTPICIIGTVGTVNTGAIDPIDELADICERENIWLHVDGAFGAALAFLPEMKEQLKGLERADSIAFDFHKWMHVTYEAGCLLMKDKSVHHKMYSVEASYIMEHDKGVSAGPSFIHLGPEMSRSARALKIWFPFKIHGLNKYADLIRQNLDQSQYLSKLINESNQLELMADTTMNIVCFRFLADGMNQDQLNKLNKQILLELHEKGIAIPTFTVLNGNYVIRVAITNHRSRLEDFDDLVDNIVRIGNEMKNSQ